jgi:hypothetical protein
MLLFGFLLMAGSATAGTVVYSGYLVNETGLGVDTNYDLDLQARGIDQMSAVVTASSQTIASSSFNDGRAATGSFTVASLLDLTTSFATNRSTVLSTMTLSGAQVRLAGIPVTEGVDWFTKATKALTATDIARALNTKFAGLIVSTAPTGSEVIYSTAVVAGASANSLTFDSTNSSITVNAATFTGGLDNAYVIIGDTKLTFNVNMAVGGTTAATATNLAAAINASSALNTKVVAQAVGSVVTATATIVGVGGQYGLASSTSSRVTPSGLTMVAGSPAAYTLNTSAISLPSHPYSTGFGVWWSTSSAVGITPLTWGTTYYIIRNSADSISLATSKANAAAETAVVLTSSGTPTSTRTFNLNVPAIAGTPSYKWRVSNDGIYWVDVSSRTTSTGISLDSVSMSAYVLGGASVAYDLGKINYRYIRFAVTAPTAGAIWIKNAVIGKKD